MRTIRQAYAKAPLRQPRFDHSGITCHEITLSDLNTTLIKILCAEMKLQSILRFRDFSNDLGESRLEFMVQMVGASSMSALLGQSYLIEDGV